MSDIMIVLLSFLGMLLLGVFGVLYVITYFGQKKSECPKCTKKTTPKNTLIIDQGTGEKIKGERDFGFAIISGIGGVLIGAALCVFVLAMVISSLGDDSCSVEGIFIKCVSYGGSSRVETTINLPIAFIALIGGLSGILKGVGRIRNAIRSKGKSMTCEFECPSCKHSWTEEVPAS